ncbi:MAG: NADP-reducing hydrogenase subunit HndC [Syntrophorhabdus sp. PtaB.Bin184]|jgi:F420-non-reducing hydrogenase iron-sulfur subunit|nr:MAG: NADP-reducing hydrogenase subunit HndC [Syntrophorhabdus sp. PtaB.Bin184]
MRIIRVMCSGRVDMGFVLRAFENGLDGVFIGACHLGECNYITHGNYQAQNMVLLFRRIMEHIGLNPERLRINFMSAAEGSVFAESVNEFVKTVKGLGPLGKGEGIDLADVRTRLAEVKKLIPYFKIVNREKLTTRFDGDHAAAERLFTKEEIDKQFAEVFSYWIDPEKCQACMTCARRCPVDAIISEKQKIHIIDQDKCVRCGTCFEVCPPKFRAISKITGPVPPPPPEDKRAVVRKGKEEAAG